MDQGLCIARLIARFCLKSIFRGGNYSNKPSMMYLRWLLVVFPCSDSSPNSLIRFPRSIMRRYLTSPVVIIVPVMSIDILKFLSIVRNSSVWTLSNIDMFMLYVYDVACEGFIWILTLMIWVACYSSNFTLMRGIRWGYIRAFTSALIHETFFMADGLVCWDGAAYVTHSHFENFHTR